MPTRKAPPTLLLLIRHGETPTTGKVLPGRAPGLHLAPAGEREAESVAERLAGLPLAAIYASPLERACETAGPTASRTGLAVVTEPGLAEMDTGEWTGERLALLARRKEWAGVLRAPSTFRFPGGESFVELQARVAGALDRIRVAHPGAVVACFSHADPIKAALVHAVGSHLDAVGRLAVDTGSVSAIAYPASGAPVVVLTNSTRGPLAYLAGG